MDTLDFCPEFDLEKYNFLLGHGIANDLLIHSFWMSRNDLPKFASTTKTR